MPTAPAWEIFKAGSTTLLRNAKLKAKVLDLESRSHRKNVRIIGLLEDIDGPSAAVFFAQLLFEVLGSDILPLPPKLDRAHRTLAAKPGPSERPRPVVVSFLSFKLCEMVVHGAVNSMES